MPERVPPPLPVMLELAPLPREQTGPFLLLGLDKTASAEQIEENWAKRVIFARKKQIRVPLEDINWAREVINDPQKRVYADAASLNLDTTGRTLARLEEKYAGSVAREGCRPIDSEKPLADYTPPVEIPDEESVRAGIVVPEVPREYPVVSALLQEFAAHPVDPWKWNEE